MITLFSDEEIWDMHLKSEKREAAKEAEKEAVKKIVSDGKIRLDEAGKYFPTLSADDIKELEKELVYKL